MKKVLIALPILLFLFTVVTLPASAASVRVTVDGAPFLGSVEVKNNTTYVGVRKFSTDLDPTATVTYHAATRTLTVQSSKLTMTVTDGSHYIVANGRYLYYEQPVFMKSGTMYAPVLQLYRAFGAGIKWSDAMGGFAVTRGSGGIAAGSSYYRNDEVLWLSRIISAEAKGEPLRGKIAVAGFRPGKAPRKMIEKLYGVEVFYEEAVNIVLPDAYESAVKEQELDVVGYPEVVQDYVGHMKKNEIQQALLELLFDGPEWQFERFVRDHDLEE